VIILDNLNLEEKSDKSDDLIELSRQLENVL